MARMGKLGALDVTRAKGPAVLHDGGGLYLRVSASGTKSWVFRFQLDGHRRDMGLGPYPDISLAEARIRATAYRIQRLDGIDPLERRNAARSSARLDAARVITFKECADAHITAHKSGWRDGKSEAQWRQSLTAYVFPIFGDLPVQSVDITLVMKAIEPIWAVKTETASRVRGRIECILDWATVRGYRQGDNPARWRGHLDKLLPQKAKVKRIEHHAALPYPAIGAFMAELRQQEGVGARALEFAILTAARSGEVRGARWNEIDLGGKTWVIPGVRMKVGVQHRVPLSDAALSIVENMAATRQGDLVFTGSTVSRPVSGAAMAALLRRIGHNDVTIHGFRSSFRDWCAERSNYPREVVEMALAHAIENKVEAAYRRSDLFERRRRLMTDWARFCEGGAADGEVVPIRA
jgi:integrase